MEIELKLLVKPHQVDALRKHPLLKKYAVTKPYAQKMSDIYFDTSDLQLRHGDAGLRVRKVHSTWVQTLKCGGSVNGGLHSRHEWESQITGPLPNLVVLRDMAGRKTKWGKLLNSPLVATKLSPIFTTQVKREVWNLCLPIGDEIECVLDLGDIEYEGHKVSISELELELKSGNPCHLFDFALELLQDIPLQIGTLSKADRGYGLHTPQATAAVKSAPVRLPKRMTIEQAAQTIAGNCMMQIQANAAGIEQDGDTESLHQMRVGLRRLRSALRIFKNLLPPPEALLREMDWLGTQLGTVRDWDVLVGTTLPMIINAKPHGAHLVSIQKAAVKEAHERHISVAAAVGSLRFTRLILNFTRWTLDGGWHDTSTAKERARMKGPVMKFAGTTLVNEQRGLRKRGMKLQGAGAKLRHRVRIAAKNTRYATEFFQSLYPPKKVQKSLDRLSGLQDDLGSLNDAAVASRLLEVIQKKEADLTEGISIARKYLVSHVENDDKPLRKHWKKFATTKRFF